MNDDAALLRRYAEEGSEDAFTELVRRQVDLVYGAALRRTGGDAHRAADVAQQVFTTLARRARRLSRHTVLSAWLHTATRNAALNLVISEQRRKARELAATLESETSNDPAAALDWDRVRPVIDAAIDELSETDRAAVILRFLERRPFADIAAALNVTEDAARMRTDRALDKLRALLGRRGITSTASALAAVVSTHPVAAAPSGLAAALASQSLVASATAGAAFATTLASLMNAKLIVSTAGAAIVAFALGAYVGLDYTASLPPPPLPETPQQVQMIASLRQDNRQLKAEVARLNAANTALAASHAAEKTAESRPAPPAVAAVAKLSFEESMVLQKVVRNNLRQIAAARDQFALENGRPPASLDELVGENKYIKQLVSVNGEAYSQLALTPGQPLSVTASDGTTITYEDPPKGTDEVRATAINPQLVASYKRAVEAYRTANNGAMPPNEQAVLPYFSTPQEGADFVEFLDARKAQRGR